MGVFDFLKQTFGSKESAQANSFAKLMDEAYNELYTEETKFQWWSIKVNELKVFAEKILTLTDKEKVAFILQAVTEISSFYKGRKTYSGQDKETRLVTIRENIMQHLLKTKLVLDDDDIIAISQAFIQNKRHDWTDHVLYWPVNLLTIQIEKQLKNRACTEQLKQALVALATEVAKTSHYYQQKEKQKVEEWINALIHYFVNGSGSVKPTYFPLNDGLGEYANAQINNANETEKPYWFRLTALARKTSGAKPSNKFLEETKALCQALGPDAFQKTVNHWLVFVINYKEEKKQHRHTYNGTEYVNDYYDFLAIPNLDTLKGFVWMCVHCHDKTMLSVIATLTERCFRKIPGKGSAAAGLGNACLYVLANSKGLDGVGHLSRLKLRIRQSSTQTLIEKYLQEAAKLQDVSIHEIEDMAVDDYGLVNGKIEYNFEGYKAVLFIAGIGKTLLQWYKPDGTLQKSVPSFIKEKFASELRKIKDTAKGIETTLTTQRDRFDRMLKTGRQLSWKKFIELFDKHGLLSYITRQLIWTFTQDKITTSGIFINDQWINPTGVLPMFTDDATITLWHPVFSSTAEVFAWRELLITHKIVQPLKQAFREVYFITDAELNTRTYSNRMAAHLLKQHQFNTLAKLRGWKYSLMGAYDDGRDNEAASILLPDYNLRAEYWINEVTADDAFNDTGIWLYIATDQVRFVDTITNNVKELIEVPALAFTEVMRDVDLFVGVASVGNDPAWRDSGGVTGYQNYWQSYSFGDLTELARTRKSMLERLLPRLKIAGIAAIQDKFLIVKGKLRTYKIHIGSTNILMEPNDQYLCIVPDRGNKSTTENVFLPFEGDNGLSVILSKAFLLADDDKITDPTITRQISRN